MIFIDKALRRIGIMLIKAIVIPLKRWIRKLIKKLMYLLKIDVFYYLYKNSQLSEEGWFRSYFERRPCDLEGKPLPWMTYAFIRFISKRINSEMTIFEYGCGSSTLWWADRVQKVISCEHDKDWYEKMIVNLPDNVQLNYISLKYNGEYSKKILEYQNEFDIIVIDGRDRVNCALNCINALKRDGVIIWDDTSRSCYQEGYDFLVKHHFKRLDLEGMSPGNLNLSSVSIFYRDNNCVGL